MSEKLKKLFISHSSKDKEYLEALIELLERIGMQEGAIVCTSIPGYGIPGGENIYDWLREQFSAYGLRVLYVLSKNYFGSATCLNEMGAAWSTKKSETLLLLPGFGFGDIKGCLDSRKMGIYFDGDEEELKYRLNELKDVLIKEHELTPINETRWERYRNSFIADVRTIAAKSLTFGIDSISSAKEPHFSYKIRSGGGIIITGITGHSIISSDVVIPGKIDGYQVFAIGDDAFSNTSLTGVTLKENVAIIGNKSFAGCGRLNAVSIPYSVTCIGHNAFAGCGSLISLTIPNSVTSIGNGAFYECSSLVTVTISNKVNSIGIGTFYGCSSLTSVIFPNSVNSIGRCAFDGCTGLTEMSIPNSVTSIGAWAFYRCSSLKSVTIPESVVSIGEGAFEGCSDLTIYTRKGSKAYQYAKEQKITYQFIE